MPTPPGPYPSNVASSYCSPSSCPVPRKIARSIFSLGMFSFLPARIAVRRRGFELGSPPPMRAAIVISRITRVNTRPRFASVAAFLCLIVAHFECPDMARPLCSPTVQPVPSLSVGVLRNRVDEFLGVRHAFFHRPGALLAVRRLRYTAYPAELTQFSTAGPAKKRAILAQRPDVRR